MTTTMSKRTSVTYRFAKWGFLLTGFYCLVNAIVISILVMGPYRPLEHSTNWGFGFAHYLSLGIPFSASSPDEKIPAESFIMTTKFGNQNTDDIYTPVPNRATPGGVTIDDSHLKKAFYGPNPEYQPTIKNVRVNEYTFYAWPEKAWQRLFLLLPQLLTWFGVAFCAWYLSKLMDDIVIHKVFAHESYRYLVYVSTAILTVEALFFIWGVFQPYHYFISIVSPYGNENLRLQGSPTSPFDLQWVAIGCVGLLISKGLQRGVVLREKKGMNA